MNVRGAPNMFTDRRMAHLNMKAMSVQIIAKIRFG